MKAAVSSLKNSQATIVDLAITKNLSKDPGEYNNLVSLAVGARHLLGLGGRFTLRQLRINQRQRENA